MIFGSLTDPDLPESENWKAGPHLSLNLVALEVKRTVEPWRAMNGGLEAKNGALEGPWPVVAHFQHFGKNPDPHLSDADLKPYSLVRKRVGSRSVLFPDSEQILRIQNSHKNRRKLEGDGQNGKKLIIGRPGVQDKCRTRAWISSRNRRRGAPWGGR